MSYTHTTNACIQFGAGHIVSIGYTIRTRAKRARCRSIVRPATSRPENSPTPSITREGANDQINTCCSYITNICDQSVAAPNARNLTDRPAVGMSHDTAYLGWQVAICRFLLFRRFTDNNDGISNVSTFNHNLLYISKTRFPHNNHKLFHLFKNNNNDKRKRGKKEKQ